jgi:hypothetical protein
MPKFQVLLIIAVGILLSLSAIPGVYVAYNPDPYLRMVLAQQLWDSGNWFDHAIMRTNPPFGIESPWTRPVDVLILIGTIPLQQIFSVQDAYLVWGVILPVLAFLVTGLLLLKITALLTLTPTARVSAIALFALNVITLNLFFPWNVDHHFLLTIAFLWLLTEVLLTLRASNQTWPALRAGLAVSLGVWVSPEFLLPAAAVLTAMGVIWFWHPLQTSGIFVQLLSTATLGLCGAVLVERRNPWQVVHDSVSVVHVALFALLSLFAAIIILLTQKRSLSSRGIAAALGGAGLFAVMNLTFPDFWRAHYLATDAFVIHELLVNVAELQPLYRSGGTGAGIILLLLAAAGAIAMSRRVWRRAASSDDLCWRIVLVTAGIMLVPCLLQNRWMSGYGIVIMPLLAAPVFAVWSEKLAAYCQKKHLFILGGILHRQGFIVLPLCLMLAAQALDALAASDRQMLGPENYAACEENLIRFTQQDGFSSVSDTPRPLTLMLPTNHAGVVWFWTPHTVIAGNYHRDTTGIRDVVTFFRADETTAYEIITRRKVDMIAYCEGEGSKDFFLAAGHVPSWLERIRTESDANLHLYRVRNRHALLPLPQLLQ